MAVSMNDDHPESATVKPTGKQGNNHNFIGNGRGYDRASSGAMAGPSTCSAATRRILLRLDDGSLICDGRFSKDRAARDAIVLLQAEKCSEVGRVEHADLLRSYRVLDAVRRGTNGIPPPAAEASPFGGGDDGGRPAKRPREERPTSPSGTVTSSGAPPPSDWLERCREMLLSVMKHLGNSVAIFDRPVDTTVVPDYYKVVKTPMDLGTMLQKINEAEYSRPADFATDMRQVWYNCKLYNKKGDYVERSGTAASLHFESLWASSGLAESKDRSRRANAGLAAAKFEPQSNLAHKKPAKSGGQSSKKGRGGGGASSKRKGKKVAAPPMSRDDLAALAQRLGELDEDSLQGVVSIIRERTQLASGADEEIELDIEALDNDTLWELHRYLENLNGSAPVTSGAAWAGQGDSGSDSDSSTESDSD
mmetsp:Transcript_19363/g.53948  ORF Transcript_19363/g.53948 Transcript_19363/m.53948 type:complete len:421 (-) Transcript_19363:278-1540(-)|eukprot:CAMPEP_0117657804 /NCGR_PEP_ID=MMETSP0804-20121206/5525_1 /TAXON_ID=1074897 /ORGANISM="Tetraselmis astigmatica, Strain CCMP880" /LENGTH=420 /DNA_ID=CAMNT_0005464281 /DNA_START=953 /DNA_END=2215 /DNA_ORIENTATION=+